MGELSDLILVIDVGNSRSKFGCLRDDAPLPRCDQQIAVTHSDQIPWKKIANWFANADFRSVAAATSRSHLDSLLKTWPADWQSPRIVENSEQFPLPNRTEFPRKVGIDRLLNAVAANRLREEDRPAIVVDSGTAVTVDAVSATGEFLGGAILPGPDLNAKSLREYTAALPLVELLAETPPAIGRRTETAIAAGLHWGHVGAVQELVDRQREQLGGTASVILTGGGADWLAESIAPDYLCPHLVLQGLAALEFDQLPN